MLKFCKFLGLFYFIQFSISRASEVNTEEPFDFIVVGGGTAGCVIASRLAENGEHTVLLIEEGGIPNPNLEVPALSAFTNLYNFPNDIKFYASVPQSAGLATGNGVIQYAIGKVIGGGSSVNGMFWNRGHPQDYDNWASLIKDPSWSYQSLLKYFKRSENYTGSNPTNERGFTGPINIEHPSFAPTLKYFFQAGQEIGYPIGDPNGPQTPSIGKIDFSQKEGRRVSSLGFIQPLLKTGKNLQIMLNTQVKRIIFKGNRAVGVTYSVNNSEGYATARNEIILTAGVMDSPAILMRSGIGPEAILREVDIPIVKELPVGENLQDHIAIQLPVIYGNRSLVVVPSRDLTPEAWKVYKEMGTSPYSSYMGASVNGFFLSNLEKPFKRSWPDIHMLPQGIEAGSVSMEAPDVQLWEVLNHWSFFVVRPKSRGSVKLNLNDVDGPPLIDFNYFSHPDDMKVMLDAVKIARKLCEGTNALRKIGCRFPSTPFPACNNFKFQSEAYWACLIRQISHTSLHAAGTCRMGGPEDPEAVVDSQLKVIGIEGLRVADASVMPQITNANTQAAVYVIAEKAADMILKEWSQHQHWETFGWPRD